MATAITCDLVSQLRVTEEFTTTDLPGVTTGAKKELTFSAHDTSTRLTSATTPNVTKKAVFRTTLSSGAATIDLSTVTNTLGVAIGTGQKVVAIKFKAGSANGAAITVGKGASNGFTGLGSSFAGLSIKIGGEALIYCKAGGVAIGAADKTLDLAGSGSSDYLDVTVLLGT